jgi:hypothetical protein
MNMISLRASSFMGIAGLLFPAIFAKNKQIKNKHSLVYGSLFLSYCIFLYSYGVYNIDPVI